MKLSKGSISYIYAILKFSINQILLYFRKIDY